MTSKPGLVTDGILSGTNTAMVHALVFHHPSPQQPPDSLAELADPIEAEDGQIQDWHINTRKLLAHREEHVHDVCSSFATWRRNYVADQVIGDVALVKAFLKWADGVRDVQTLRPLKLGNTRIDAKMTTRVAWDVHEVGQACRSRGEMGLGISAPQRPGLVRGFVVGDEPVLLLADKQASVSALRDALEVRQSGSESLPEAVLVRGWIVASDGISAISDEGPVPLDGTSAGRLLARASRPGWRMPPPGPRRSGRCSPA